MSQTMSAALKTYLEGLGLGVAFYRDGAPKGADGVISAAWPYGTIQEGIGYAPELHGDTDDPAAHNGTDELMQVDLWQRARGVPTPASGGRAVVLERYDLPSQIDNALRSRRGLAAAAPFRVYGMTVIGGQRLSPSDNVVRHTWTVRIRRDTKLKGA